VAPDFGMAFSLKAENELNQGFDWKIGRKVCWGVAGASGHQYASWFDVTDVS
jgi:hypothetical protein